MPPENIKQNKLRFVGYNLPEMPSHMNVEYVRLCFVIKKPSNRNPMSMKILTSPNQDFRVSSSRGNQNPVYNNVWTVVVV